MSARVYYLTEPVIRNCAPIQDVGSSLAQRGKRWTNDEPASCPRNWAPVVKKDSDMSWKDGCHYFSCKIIHLQSGDGTALTGAEDLWRFLGGSLKKAGPPGGASIINRVISRPAPEQKVTGHPWPRSDRLPSLWDINKSRPFVRRC